MFYALMGYLHAAIHRRVNEIRRLAGETGQGTVEYVGLILLVSLLMVGMVAAMKGFNRDFSRGGYYHQCWPTSNASSMPRCLPIKNVTCSRSICWGSSAPFRPWAALVFPTSSLEVDRATPLGRTANGRLAPTGSFTGLGRTRGRAAGASARLWVTGDRSRPRSPPALRSGVVPMRGRRTSTSSQI